jgi:hypothetical protein
VTQLQWERWLWTCILALLPLLLWLLIVQVIGVEWRTGAAEISRELLFFSLTICIVVLSDLRDVDIATRDRYGYESFFIGSIVIVAVAAGLYGFFLSVHAQPKNIARLFALSMTVGVAGFVVGTRAQILIHSGGANAGHR